MADSKRDPRCCICGDAYGTQYVCAPCKADPANVDWREADAREHSSEQAPDAARGADGIVSEGHGPVWNPTELQRRIVQALMAGASLRTAARLTGAGVTQVRTVAKWLKSAGY